MGDHRGILYVSLHFLVEALHIPEGTEILDVTREFGSDRIMLHVRHSDLEDVPRGIRAPEVSLDIFTHSRPGTPDDQIRMCDSRWHRYGESRYPSKPLEI